MAEVDDPIILYGFLGGFALNLVLATQMLWYWNAGTKLAAGPKKEKQHYMPPPGSGSGSGSGSSGNGRGTPKAKSSGRKKA